MVIRIRIEVCIYFSYHIPRRQPINIYATYGHGEPILYRQARSIIGVNHYTSLADIAEDFNRLVKVEIMKRKVESQIIEKGEKK